MKNIESNVLIAMVVLLIPLLLIQWIWLSGHFKKLSSKRFAENGNYLKYFLGRGGTGFIGVDKNQITIFKDVQKIKKIPYKNLYVYRVKSRFDFKENADALTIVDKTYGIILSKNDAELFAKFAKENNVNMA